jgi:hypothetical protein
MIWDLSTKTARNFLNPPRYNLYLVKEKTLRPTEAQGAIEVIANRIYEKFVGEPFKTRRQTKPGALPKLEIAARRPRTTAWQT